MTYACVADVAANYAANPAVHGVLYFHFDLWLKPWELHHVLREGVASSSRSPAAASLAPELASSWPSLLDLLDSPWALPQHRMMVKAPGPTRLLPIECFNASQPEEYLTRFTTRHPRDASLRPIPAWTWARDLPPARAALHETCGRAATPGCNPHTICIGWADLYYVPSKLHLSFRRLAHGLARGGANAELAVPTMMHILAQESRRPLHRLPCWGFCCSATPCPDLLLRHACGHRMRLEMPAMRHALQSLWRV